MRSLSPAGEPGLEKDDVTFGMNQPSLEGSVHSPNPGPDRPKPELQEMAVENYDDSVVDYQDEIARQLELGRSMVGDVVVHKAPLKLSAEDKLMDSTYSRIIAAMKRLATTATAPGDDESEQAAPPAPADVPYSSGNTGVDDVEQEPAWAKRRREEYERKRRELAEQQAAAIEEGAKPQTGDMSRPLDEQVTTEEAFEPTKITQEDIDQRRQQFEATRQEMADKGEPVSEYPDLIAAARKHAEAHVERTEKLLGMLNDFIDFHTTAFRQRKAADTLLSTTLEINEVARKSKSSQVKKVAAEANKLISELREAGGKGSIRMPAEGITLIQSLRASMSRLNVGNIADAIMNAAGLQKLLDKRKDKSSKDEAAAKRMMAEYSDELKHALELVYKAQENKNKKILAAAPGVEKMAVLRHKKMEALADKLESLMSRAEAYSKEVDSLQSAVSDVPGGRAVTDEQLAAEKENAASVMLALQTGISEIQKSRGAERASALRRMVMMRLARESKPELGEEMDSIMSEYMAAISEWAKGEIEFQKADSAISAAAAETDKSVAPLNEMLSGLLAAPQQPASSPAAEPEPAEEGWMDKLRGLLPDMSMSQAVPVAASSDDAISRVAVDKPRGFGMDITEEELNNPRQQVSPAEKKKMDLARKNLEQRQKKVVDDSAKPLSDKADEQRMNSAAADELRDRVGARVVQELGVATSEKRASDENMKAAFLEVNSALGKSIAEEAEKRGLSLEGLSVRHEGESQKGGPGGRDKGRPGFYVVDGNGKKVFGPYQDEAEARKIAGHASVRAQIEAKARSLRQGMADIMAENAKANGEFFDNFSRFFENVRKSQTLYLALEDLGVVIDARSRTAFADKPGDFKAAGPWSKIGPAMNLATEYIMENLPPEEAAKGQMALGKLKKFVRAAADKIQSLSVRSHGVEERHRKMVEEMTAAERAQAVEMAEGPAGEYVAEPLKGQGPSMPDPLQAPAPAEGDGTSTKSSLRFAAEDAGIMADLDAMEADLKAIAAEVSELGSTMSDAMEFSDAVGKAHDAIVPKLSEALEAAKADMEGEGMTWDKAKEMGRGVLNKIRDSIMPEQEMSPAMATAGKDDSLSREAGSEYDHFDQSKNRLEIVEGEGGKKKLVINKGLKSLVSRKVHEMVNGGFKCGDTVQVDFTDYLGTGTVKAYIGSGVYRIDVDGSIMEVPAKNVLGLGETPWR